MTLLTGAAVELPTRAYGRDKSRSFSVPQNLYSRMILSVRMAKKATHQPYFSLSSQPSATAKQRAISWYDKTPVGGLSAKC
jgi:hypothetical protein